MKQMYTINDVKSFDFFEKAIFYSSKGGLYRNDFFSSEIIVNDIDCFKIVGTKVLYQTKSNKVVKVLDGNSLFGQFYLKTIVKNCNESFFIINLNEGKKEQVYFNSNLDPIAVFSSAALVRYIHENDCCIYNVSKGIIYHSIIDNKTLWHLSFQELTGVENIELHSDLVVVGNKLFFYLTNRLHNGVASTFCIDINSGKLIKEIPEFTGDVKLFDGMLYSTCASVLEIMNPDNFTITKHDLSSELTKNDFVSISHFRWLVDGNRFYFVQDVGSHQAKVGVVDLRTMKITDKHVFPRKCGSIGTIKVSGNKLYVHTQDETLHIFEV